MSFRLETRLNAPIKGNMKGVQWEQAAKYGLLHDLSDKKVNIASVKQDDICLTIIKRIDTKKGFWYNHGFPQKGFFERVVFNRKEKTVVIDSFEDKWNVKTGPYMWSRDLYWPDEEVPNKLVF